jgi:hypothetical protein
MIEAILDECLEAIRAKRSTMADCLARYPQISADLKPLLEMALAIEQVPDIAPSDEFKRATRARILHATDPNSQSDRRADRGRAFGDDPIGPVPARRPAESDT